MYEQTSGLQDTYIFVQIEDTNIVYIKSTDSSLSKFYEYTY